MGVDTSSVGRSSSLHRSDTRSSSSATSVRSAADPRDPEGLRTQLLQELSVHEQIVLCDLVPALFPVFGHQCMAKDVKRRIAKHRKSNPAAFYLTDAVAFRQHLHIVQHAVRQLIRIVSQHCPIVWIVDDIHSADSATLRLFKWILFDREITSLLVIACCGPGDGLRGDLEDGATAENAALAHSDFYNVSAFLKDIEERHQNRSLVVTKLVLDNLKVSQVNQLLARFLNASRMDETYEFSKVLHEMTNGNPFFLRVILRELSQRQHFTYVASQNSWIWDDVDIIQSLPNHVTIPNMLKAKFEEHSAIRRVLPIAACLGFKFSSYVLRSALTGLARKTYHKNFYWKIFQNDPVSSDVVFTQVMDKCEEDGLIEYRTSFDGRRIDYAFAHNEIHRAALLIVPVSVLEELRYRIGDCLLEELPPESLKHHQFTVADLLNVRYDQLPSITLDGGSGGKRMRIVRLNLNAGCKAVKLSAFSAALSYFRSAIRILPNDHWKVSPTLSLDLFFNATECAQVVGDYKSMNAYGEVLLSLPAISDTDKARVYHIFMSAGMHRAEQTSIVAASDAYAKLDEARQSSGPTVKEYGINVLQQLGCNISSTKLLRSVAGNIELLKIKASSARWTPQTVNSLPIASDAKELAIAKTFDLLVRALESKSVFGSTTSGRSSRKRSSRCADNARLLTQLVVRSIQRAFRFGITPWTSHAFALLSVIAASTLGDARLSHICVQFAESLNIRIMNQATYLRSILTLNARSTNWMSPIEECQDGLHRAYETGMAIGDAETAMLALYHSLCNAFCTGQSLSRISQDLSGCAELCMDYGCVRTFEASSSLRQTVSNLMTTIKSRRFMLNDSTSSTVQTLDDDGDNTDDNAAQCFRTVEDEPLQQLLNVMKICQATILGDHELATTTALEHYTKMTEALTGETVCMYVTFLTALSCEVVAKRTMDNGRTRTACIGLAKKCRKAMNRWIENGNPNVVHQLSIVDGERHASTSIAVATKYFESAIATAEKLGFLHDQALANERLAECLILHDGDNLDLAEYHFREARRLYSLWGAHKKNEELKRRIRCKARQ